MASILYYSNYCENSKGLLNVLSKSQLKEKLHYLCIDNRCRKQDGSICIILENNQEILLPPNIVKVPALLLLSKNNEVVFGKENIINYLRPQEEVINQRATEFNGEPSSYCFGFSNIGTTLGVISDNYSFLDQSSDSMCAKGDGGLRQMYHYSALNYNQKIETPPDNYSPDKIGKVSMEKIQQSRNEDVYQNKR